MKRLPFISWIALVLWVVTVVGVGLLYVKGGATPGEDERIVLQVNKDEKRFILSEMREMLETVHDIMLALDANNMKSVGEAVKGKGIADMMRNTPKILIAKVPVEFMALGRGMHKGFDDIGEAVAGGAGKDRVISLLGEQLGQCVACHASYQLPNVK